ncbi:MAG TPA: TonB family protein [Pyrinomonadaceae bacterium]|nr:TonB family protein [Pyrinomonadaceae bacterium]
MFDRLIESDTSGFTPRRRYFIVSSLVVGLLFISAVVISLYAADIGLGNDTYELSALITPVQPPAEAPEPPQPQQQQRTTTERTSDVPTRVVMQQPIDDVPRTMPPISTVPNRFLSIPSGLYKIGPQDTEPPAGMIGNPNATGSSGLTGTDGRDTPGTRITSPKEELPPPPPAAKPRPRSIGVANGYAISLPKPPYPPIALATNAQGKVDVQITIDEQGNVVSAKAVDGPVLLRQAAEQAAWKAKFKPTKLSDVPIKVTGVIVYNFTRN